MTYNNLNFLSLMILFSLFGIFFLLGKLVAQVSKESETVGVGEEIEVRGRTSQS